MVLISLRYRFRQKLRAPARAAYAWCTAYEPADGALFSQTTRRSVRRLTDDAVILTDVRYPKGQARTIRRLVRLDPARHAWTNTHLDGPYRHSQFWYRIVPAGPRASYLEFEGFQLTEVPSSIPPKEIRRRSRLLKRQDSAEWRDYLAPALAAYVAGH